MPARLPAALLTLLAVTLTPSTTTATPSQPALITVGADTATTSPLSRVRIAGAPAGSVARVRDAAGNVYATFDAASAGGFSTGGAAGRQTVELVGPDDTLLASLPLQVEARLRIDDAPGTWSDFLKILDASLRVYGPTGTGRRTWRGRTYEHYVYWILDHTHTAKGMQFLHHAPGDFAELLAVTQRQDGMVWSFINRDPGPDHYDSAYGPYGYARREDGLLFVRQPVENHNEYCFVNTIHLAWKASGDNAWAARMVDAAIRALEYSRSDPARWSTRHGLLKRGYTIDSWDFQAEDEHLVPFPLADRMNIDPARTRFGIFHGDNTGYASAAGQLAEMLDAVGRPADATRWREIEASIRSRLDALSWNGRFFTHWVPDNPAITSDLGVDEASQVSLSNAYALNRGIRPDQAAAIINTYRTFRDQPPQPGAVAEWYAIFPPFGRGFGAADNNRWQYMNGGIAGHAAGELALGCFANDDDAYGVDTLRRLHDLGRRHGNRVRFAYRGGLDPAPAPATFYQLDLSSAANMALSTTPAAGALPWMAQSQAGNDLARLPHGRIDAAGIPFDLPERTSADAPSTIGVSTLPGFPRSAVIHVRRTFGALYLLHAVGASAPPEVAGLITIHYGDGSSHSRYLRRSVDVANWWYPSLPGPRAGVAWQGPNSISNRVGLSWVEIANPHPDRPVTSITLEPSAAGGCYAVAAATVADRPIYIEPGEVSTGGPDNWTAGTALLALIEGLAGIHNPATAYSTIGLSPRWLAAGIDEVHVTAPLPASGAYVAYDYQLNRDARSLTLHVAGNGSAIDADLRIPAPPGSSPQALVNGQPVAVSIHARPAATSVTFKAPLTGTARIEVRW